MYNKIFTQNPIQDGWVLYTDCDCPDGMQYVNDKKKMQITHLSPKLTIRRLFTIRKSRTEIGYTDMRGQACANGVQWLRNDAIFRQNFQVLCKVFQSKQLSFQSQFAFPRVCSVGHIQKMQQGSAPRDSGVADGHVPFSKGS